MIITKEKIKPGDVNFLCDEKTLYTSDFRVIGESMDYKIPAMWKYENLMPWILEGKKVFINGDCNIDYSKENNLIIIPKDPNPQISIYKRAEKIILPEDIENLWVAIPHPDADSFTKKKNLKINYSYKDFLYKNNKIKQKKLLGDLTPSWIVFSKRREVKEFISTKQKGFLKQEHGSGGFTVFNLNEEKEKKELTEMVDKNNINWFFEEQVSGVPYSIQCLKEKNSEKVVVFGFAKQLIEKGKHFKGLDIKPLESIREDVFNSLCVAIERVNPLLRDYEGFFGIDFFIDKSKNVLVLEFNIRLTSATIPVLLINEKNNRRGVYLEEEQKTKKENQVINLNYDNTNKKFDYLKIFKKKNA